MPFMTSISTSPTVLKSWTLTWKHTLVLITLLSIASVLLLRSHRSPRSQLFFMTNFTGVFLTVENHGCVYTICTEGELYYAPILASGNVNMNEFHWVDFDVAETDYDELDEIQSALIDMMQRAGLYFQQPVAV